MATVGSFIATAKPSLVRSVALVASAGTGVVAAVSPMMGVGLVGVAWLAGLLMFSNSFALIVLLISSSVDILRSFGGGGVTLLGLCSAFYAAASWLLWMIRPRIRRDVAAVAAALLLYFGWSFILSLEDWLNSSTGNKIQSSQNIIVLLAFIGLILLCTRDSKSSVQAVRYVSGAMQWLPVGSAILYFLVRTFLPPQSILEMGPRSFSLFALMGVAWHVAGWRYGSKLSLLAACVITLVIGYSLSRTALVVAALLFALAWFEPWSIRGWVRFTVSSVLGVGAIYYAIYHVAPLRDRFFEGDVSLAVGGVSVNASGRTEMWETILASYRESPWLGKGLGSSQVLIDTRMPGLGHPHNDYLRILHDHGAVGMVLWVLGYGGLMVLTFRAWLRADPQRDGTARLHLAAFLALIAIAIGMITDNPIVYIFVMAPLAVLVGTSLGQKE